MGNQREKTWKTINLQSNYQYVGPIMESQMEKKMEDEMEIVVI